MNKAQKFVRDISRNYIEYYKENINNYPDSLIEFLKKQKLGIDELDFSQKVVDEILHLQFKLESKFAIQDFISAFVRLEKKLGTQEFLNLVGRLKDCENGKALHD